jgi:hypothetical protein
LQNGTPYATKQSIVAEFEAGRLMFFSRYGFTGTRIEQLIETDAVTVASGAPLDTKIAAWTQNADFGGFAKPNVIAKTFITWSGNGVTVQPTSAASVAAQLAAKPAGMRVVSPHSLTGFTMLPSAGNPHLSDNSGALVQDGEIDFQNPAYGGYKTPWCDLVASAVCSDWMPVGAGWTGKTLAEVWQTYFPLLKAECDARAITVDELMLDTEDILASWQVYSAGGEFNVLRSDPRRAALEAALGFSLGNAGDEAAWAGFPACKSARRAWKYNAYLQHARCQQIAALVSAFRASFPQARVGDYNYQLQAPGTVPTADTLAPDRSPLSPGCIPYDGDTGYSSQPFYGGWTPAQQVAYFPENDSLVTLPGEAPNPNVQPSATLSWSGFLSDMLLATNMTLADSGPRQGYVTAWDYNGCVYRNTDLWFEVVYHLRVLGFRLLYYTESQYLNSKKMSDALIETDEVLQYEGWIPDMPTVPLAASYYSSTHLVNSCDSAGRRKYRVTPRLGSIWSQQIDGGGVFRLTVGGAEVLTIPRATLYTPSVNNSSQGVWVFQANPTPETPPAPGSSTGFRHLLDWLFFAMVSHRSARPADTNPTRGGTRGTRLTRSGPRDTTLRRPD